jgi:SanA protein
MIWLLIVVRYILFFLVLMMGMMIANYLIISIAGNSRIIDNHEDIDPNTMILVLGAGSTEPGLWVNPSFDNRMLKTLEVYNTGKINKVVMSGLYRPPYYDEPHAMQRVLTEGGIPVNKLEADYGGTRTWESVVQAKKQHPKTQFIIITQKAQLQRAIFISMITGLKANGIVATDHPNKHWQWMLREVLARLKCSADCLVYLIKKN